MHAELYCSALHSHNLITSRQARLELNAEEIASQFKITIGVVLWGQAGLQTQQAPTSLAPNQQPGLKRVAYNSQFASHPNLSTAMLQQQATQMALQQQQAHLSQQQVRQLDRLHQWGLTDVAPSR